MEKQIRSTNAAEKQSVEALLEGLSSARKACQTAKRADAVSDIEEAEKNYQAHLERIEKALENPVGQKDGPVTLEELEKSGDPSCPIGQGYQHPVLKKLIKCSGTALIDMDRKEAIAHFTRQKYEIVDNESVLEVYKGQSAYRYTYSEPELQKVSECLQILVPEGQTFQHAASFATNVPVEEIEYGKPVKLERGTLPMDVSESPEGTVVGLGKCKDAPPLRAREEEAPEKPTPSEAPPSEAPSSKESPSPGAQDKE